MSYIKTSLIQQYAPTEILTTYDLNVGLIGQNEIGDILVLNIAMDGPRTLTSTPSGWTMETNTAYAGQIGHAVLTRRATAANESLPTITLSAADDISVNYLVVYGCPGTGAYKGNTSTASGATTDTATWTSMANSANSSVLFLACIDAAKSYISDSVVGAQKISESNGTGSTALVLKQFYPSAGTTGTVTADFTFTSVGEQWQCFAIEFLDSGVGETPIRFSNKPASRNKTDTDSTNTWRNALTASQVDHTDGTSIAGFTTTFTDANITAATDRITITSHPYPSTYGYVVQYNTISGTKDSGLVEGGYYYVHYIDANTVQLMVCPDKITSSATTQLYEQSAPVIVDLIGDGSGTFQLKASRVINYYNSGATILNAPLNSEVGLDYQAVGVTYSTPRDMTGEVLILPVGFTTAFSQGVWITLIDSAGDYKTWKIYEVGKNLIVTAPVFLDPTDTNFTYEYNTFDLTAVKSIVVGTLYATANSRSTWTLDYANMWFTKVAKIIGGAGTVNGTWGDVYNELNFYIGYTSSKPSGSQLVLKHLLQLGDGTNDLTMLDGAKSLAFPPPSDGVTSISERYVNVGILVDLTASSSVKLTSELLASENNFDFEVQPTSSSSATLQVRNTTFKSATVTALTNNDFRASTFSKCPEVQADGADFTNATFSETTASATEAAISFASNDTLEGATIDLTGTIAGYHIELGTSVTAFTLTNVTFTGTPGTNKIHVLATVGTVDITVSGGSTIIAGDITSEGATVNLIAPTFDLTVNSSEASSLIQVFDTGTQTLIDSTTGSQLIYTHAGETVDIVVQKAGFRPQRQTGIVLSGNVTISYTLVDSPVYDAAHGLTYTTDASWDRATNRLTVPTFGPTGRQIYSLMIDAFISESSLYNTPFNIFMNGPKSMFLTEDAEGASDASISNITECGVRYLSSAGAITAEWCAIKSIGTATGFQGEYQQIDGSGTTDARATGVFNQTIKTYGDVTHGSFDYRDHLILKYQPNGYRPVRVDVLDTYGISALEPDYYIVAMEPQLIDGLTPGDPLATGLTITKHATPQSYDAGDGAKDYSITITDTGSNDAHTIQRWINYYLSLDATFEGLDPFNWPELVLDSGGNHETLRGIVEGDGTPQFHGVYVTEDGSTPHPDFTRFQADDGTYGTPPTLATVSITGMVTNSRLRIYNVTTATEIFNDIVGATSYTAYYLEGTDYTNGDTVDVSVMYYNMTTAKLCYTASVVASTSGFSVAVAQQDDEVYNTYGLDGQDYDLVFAADYINNEVDVNVAADFAMAELYAWWVFNLYSDAGLAAFCGGMTAQDAANIRINSSVVSIYIDNTTSTNLKQTDNIRIYRADGAYPVKSSGGGGIDVVWRDKVYLAETGVSGLTPTESSNLATTTANAARLAALLEDVSGDRFTAKALETAPSGTLTAADVRIEMDANSTQLAAIVADTNELQLNQGNWLTADVSGLATSVEIAALNDFNPATDIVAHVTLVDTVTTNSDMRGTDNAMLAASYTAPDNASITAIKAKTDGLNFTGTDVKATLDGEEVTTDAASRTASKADVSALATSAEIAALNNLSAAQVNAEVDTALADYGTATKADTIAASQM